MDEKRKVVVLALVIFGAIAVLVGGYFLFFAGGPHAAPPSKPAERVAAKPAGPTGESIPVFPLTPLDSSDDLIRKLAKELSSNATLDSWLATKDLVRKFTAAVDNVARGASPAKQIDFWKPLGTFSVYKVGPDEYIDPASYDRYNTPAEVFVSFDPVESVRFYKGLKPLFQEAYKDLGYPDKDFDQTLKKAVVELLEAPIVEGNVRVEKKVKTYAYADSRLESLSDAQKEFLRMGPANVETIQLKLREMARALGLAEDLIPKPKHITER
jgi:hypothetical protein